MNFANETKKHGEGVERRLMTIISRSGPTEAALENISSALCIKVDQVLITGGDGSKSYSLTNDDRPILIGEWSNLYHLPKLAEILAEEGHSVPLSDDPDDLRRDCSEWREALIEAIRLSKKGGAR